METNINKRIEELEKFKERAEEIISFLNNKIKYLETMDSETMEFESMFMDRLERLERLTEKKGEK